MDSSRWDVLIPLSKTGKYAWQYTAIVSPGDADLADFNWSVYRKNISFYARRTIITNGEEVNTWMHRIIAERMIGRALVDKEIVDHANGIGGDNRRENLRVATSTQNQQNRPLTTDSASGYKGVRWYTGLEKWNARITVNKKRNHLGYFTDLLDAHRAYCEAAVKYHGEFANFGVTSPFTPEMFSVVVPTAKQETEQKTEQPTEWSQEQAWKMFRVLRNLASYKDKVNTPNEPMTRRKDAVIKALVSADELLNELYDNMPNENAA
jgi:hypothetical protein